MGFFDFLRRFSDKKKEEIKEIKIEELEEWITSYFSQIFEKIDLELMNIKEKIDEEKKIMQENIQKLKEAKLKNTKIPERAKQLMEGNRKTYIQKVTVLLKKIDLPKKFDEISGFCNIFDKDLDYFSKSTIRNYYILQEFFNHEASAISMNIRNLSNLMKKVKKIVKNTKIEQEKELKDKIKEMQQKLKRKEEFKEEIKLVKEKLVKENRNITEKENKIKELKEGRDYKKFNTLINKVKELKQEQEELEKVRSNYFSGIKTALKKFERLTLDDELVRQYLNDSLKTLLADKELKIVRLVGKMKESIIKRELQLNEKKKKRILWELNKLDINYFESFLNKRNELNKKLNDLNLEIGKVEVIKEIEKIKEEVKQNKVKIERYNNKVKENVGELGKINIKTLEENLRECIKENIGEEIKIIS